MWFMHICVQQSTKHQRLNHSDTRTPTKKHNNTNQVEGSFWGGAEFKANVLNLLESLQKSKREERAKEKLKKYEATPAPNRAKRRELDRLTK